MKEESVFFLGINDEISINDSTSTDRDYDIGLYFPRMINEVEECNGDISKDYSIDLSLNHSSCWNYLEYCMFYNMRFYMAAKELNKTPKSGEAHSPSREFLPSDREQELAGLTSNLPQGFHPEITAIFREGLLGWVFGKVSRTVNVKRDDLHIQHMREIELETLRHEHKVEEMRLASNLSLQENKAKSDLSLQENKVKSDFGLQMIDNLSEQIAKLVEDRRKVADAYEKGLSFWSTEIRRKAYIVEIDLLNSQIKALSYKIDQIKV